MPPKKSKMKTKTKRREKKWEGGRGKGKFVLGINILQIERRVVGHIIDSKSKNPSSI